MMYSLFYLLFALGDEVNVNLVGEISISGIFLIFAFAKMLITGKLAYLLKHDRNLVHVTKLYMLLLGVQIITEIFVGNVFSNAMKGIAVTMLSYMKFMFFWSLISKHPRHIIWLLLWTSVAKILFVNEDEVDVQDILSGESFSFFKFTIAPLIANGLVLLSLVYRRRTKRLYLLFFYVGLMCIVLGARSTGLSITLTGLIAAFYMRNRKVKRSTVTAWCTFGTIAAYGLYVVYVNAVLSGAIVGGNSSAQLKMIKNPYNPINLLMVGRAETPAEVAAITDSPWIGWGAWAKDPGLKYHAIAAAALGVSRHEYYPELSSIPGHSVIFQAGVNNGIFAMIIMIAILWYFLRRGYLSLNKNNPYLYLIIFCMMQLIWNGLFSPMSHFRGWFPIYFICCLLAYEHVKACQKAPSKLFYGKSNFGCNGDVR